MFLLAFCVALFVMNDNSSRGRKRTAAQRHRVEVDDGGSGGMRDGGDGARQLPLLPSVRAPVAAANAAVADAFDDDDGGRGFRYAGPRHSDTAIVADGASPNGDGRGDGRGGGGGGGGGGGLRLSLGVTRRGGGVAGVALRAASVMTVIAFIAIVYVNHQQHSFAHTRARNCTAVA